MDQFRDLADDMHDLDRDIAALEVTLGSAAALHAPPAALERGELRGFANNREGRDGGGRGEDDSR